VSQNNIDQGQAAETKTFIRQVRAASSWKGSEEK
ncbi:uncharacterized protein METZ01_LOCUS251773, partial [marine metagenome]